MTWPVVIIRDLVTGSVGQVEGFCWFDGGLWQCLRFVVRPQNGSSLPTARHAKLVQLRVRKAAKSPCGTFPVVLFLFVAYVPASRCLRHGETCCTTQRRFNERPASCDAIKDVVAYTEFVSLCVLQVHVSSTFEEACMWNRIVSKWHCTRWRKTPHKYRHFICAVAVFRTIKSTSLMHPPYTTIPISGSPFVVQPPLCDHCTPPSPPQTVPFVV